jgi:hypothetical protein
LRHALRVGSTPERQVDVLVLEIKQLIAKSIDEEQTLQAASGIPEWRKRTGVDKALKPHQFIEKWYGTRIADGMAPSELRKLDFPLYNAYLCRKSRYPAEVAFEVCSSARPARQERYSELFGSEKGAVILAEHRSLERRTKRRTRALGLAR